jgi:Domain of unknown function (DUF1830)
MTSAYPPFPGYLSDRILCYYTNTTHQVQRICIRTIPNWLFEQVIFPQQRLLFESTPEAQLEVYTCSSMSNVLLSRILCIRLQVNDQPGRSDEIISSSELAHQIS